MGEARGARGVRVLLALLLAVGCSALLFHFQYRHDNKYTGYRPAARDGVMWLNNADAWGNRNLLLHLVEGWEFYGDRLLAPEDIPGSVPDAYLFIGQYGGLNLSDRTRTSYGDATYRTVILTDGVARSYALELPEIFSAYRIWINGEPAGGRGAVGAAYRPEVGGGFLTFSATDRVEIVIQVSDHDSYYSGLVYPPAFGAPDAVQRMLAARVAVHAVAWAVALLVGVFCLIPWQGWRGGGRRQLLMALFAVFFMIYSGYPLLHGWGVVGIFWYGLERAARQMMTVCLLLVTGELCGVHRKIARGAAVFGILMGLLLLHPQSVVGGVAGGFYLVGALVRYWHRAAALLLVGFGVWGLWRRSVPSTGLLAAALVFAYATVMDQVYYYEPIIGGWFAETAGFLILLIVAGVLRAQARETERERLALREHRGLLEARFDLQLREVEAERAYAQHIHTLRHESEGHYTLLQEYLEQGRTERAVALLRELRHQLENAAPVVRYCGNPLVNNLLAVKLAAAERMGVRVEWEVVGIPDVLPIPDRDLMSALMNILNNALEALEPLPPDPQPELSLRLAYDGSGLLSIACDNSFAGELREEDGKLRSAKADRRGHGLGLTLVRELADRHQGVLRIGAAGGLFRLTLILNLYQP